MQSEWTFIEEYSEKKQGYVWKVKRDVDEEVEYGYFKFIRKHNIPFSGPMVANEMIATLLGEKVGLPMHQLEYATINGNDGVVSVVKRLPPDQKLLRWDHLPKDVYQNIANQFKKPKNLIRLFVFDVWTCNTDRGTDKNLIVYRYDNESKYRFYVIDHNHALLDAEHKWKNRPYTDEYWDHIHRYYRCPTGVETLVLQNRKYVKKCIRRIQSIPAEEIKEIVWEIPKKYISKKERKLVYKLLLHRQEKLSRMIDHWFKRQVSNS